MDGFVVWLLIVGAVVLVSLVVGVAEAIDEDRPSAPIRKIEQIGSAGRIQMDQALRDFCQERQEILRRK